MASVKEKVKTSRILTVVHDDDLQKGIDYYPYYIKFIKKTKSKNLIINHFKVESERTSQKYTCNVTVKPDNSIEDLYCECPKFEQDYSCKHVAACLYQYYDVIFDNKGSNDDLNLLITKEIFSLLNDDTEKKRFVKEEVKLEVYLDGGMQRSYYNEGVVLSIKVGTDKLYSCKDKKLVNFLDAIEKQQEFNFGTKFTYNPEKNYFNKDNQEIINFLQIIKLNERGYYGSYFSFRGSNAIKNLLSILGDRKFNLNGYDIQAIKESFPFETNLTANKDMYKLNFKFDASANFITSNAEYVQIKNVLYHLYEKDRLLLLNIIDNQVDELSFSKDKKDAFVKNILPIIKDKVEISQDIDDIKISKDIKPQLYFDLYRDKVICNLKFLYDENVVDYFDVSNKIVRDKDLENVVLEDLYQYSFVVENQKILLEGLENIGKFIEEDLEEITKKYETFTSEKLKKISVLKKTNVSSTFSIGKDNIMSYSFDLGDIKDEDIVNIFESLKSKKKYYKLKSGDIINLYADEDLQELEELSEEMNLTKKQLEEGSGEIPKYRAIYFDSLKNNKYHIIKTNNLFDELINKFNQFKDVDINLTKKDKEILRPYQVEGVKWLYNIDKTGFGGILADEMGLGKSIQAIYYIKELLKENENYKFLIVAPTSLAYNWENEFEKFGPEIKIKVLSGPRDIRRKNLEDIDSTNVLITTYGLVREDSEYYEKMNFKSMLIDEAQNIKNPAAGISKTVKSVNAETKIALTGTPIENSVTELWSIFDFIMPGFLASRESFESRYRVKDFDEDTTGRLGNLNRLTHPFILRRRKKEVITDLPGKIENNIYVELTTEQKKIYVAELEKVNQEMTDILGSGGISKARFLILKLLTKLRQICIDPRILFEDYKGGSGKIEEFLRVVKTNVSNGHKILVFTSFKAALDIAKTELANNDITSYTIDGSVPSKKRLELVNKFNNDKTNVFFIMLKAGGTGLNLTSADIVIHLDLWWNPQAENQATDRAHRIGQKNVVEVIRFITKGTIEEKILDLQEKKKLLSDKLIDEEVSDKAFSKLTEKDIKDLLSYENAES